MKIVKEEIAISFGNFDSKQLDLRKVCLPLDNLDRILSLKLEDSVELSPSTRKLSWFFSEAVDESLHIVVERPPDASLVPFQEFYR